MVGQIVSTAYAAYQAGFVRDAANIKIPSDRSEPRSRGRE